MPCKIGPRHQEKVRCMTRDTRHEWERRGLLGSSAIILRGFTVNVKKMGLVGAITVRCLSTRHLRTPTSSPTLDTRASMYWNGNPSSVVPFRTLKLPFASWTWFSVVWAVPRLASSSQDRYCSAPCPEKTFQQGQTCSPPARLEAMKHWTTLDCGPPTALTLQGKRAAFGSASTGCRTARRPGRRWCRRRAGRRYGCARVSSGGPTP